MCQVASSGSRRYDLVPDETSVGIVQVIPFGGLLIPDCEGRLRKRIHILRLAERSEISLRYNWAAGHTRLTDASSHEQKESSRQQ